MLRSPLVCLPMSQNYKDTLNLPRTDFPMKANLAAREPEMLRNWEAERLYQEIQKSRESRELFVLHDGPPFANGDVHMGTALNKILKDFVVKSQTMLGKRAPYIPGWDCHGLPIEYKVVKESRALSPLEVRKKSEAFAQKFINIQREQFKRLGVFGDWEHPYLTMEPKYEAEILRERAEDFRFVFGLHREIRMFPIAEHAQPLELFPLDVDEFLRKRLGFFADLQRRKSARFLYHFVFDRQTVAVPAGD